MVATKKPSSGGMGYSLYSPELDLHVVAIRGTDANRFSRIDAKVVYYTRPFTTPDTGHRKRSIDVRD